LMGVNDIHHFKIAVFLKIIITLPVVGLIRRQSILIQKLMPKPEPFPGIHGGIIRRLEHPDPLASGFTQMLQTLFHPGSVITINNIFLKPGREIIDHHRRNIHVLGLLKIDSMNRPG